MTDDVKALASQFTRLVTRALAERQSAVQPTRLDEVETRLREVLRTIGAQALGTDLSTPVQAPPKQVAGACGEKLTYQREREVVIMNIFGRVRDRRSYYAGCPYGPGQAPRPISGWKQEILTNWP